MPGQTQSDRTLSTGEAAVLLSGADDPAATRLRRAVDASLARHGLTGADRDDARAEVALALLTASPRPRLELDAACALAARIARNKAVDQHRRRRHEAADDRALDRIAVPVEGRLAHDLDAVSGEAHRRAVRGALAELVGELPAAEQQALVAAAAGSGAEGSGLGRSSHYRALERARGRLAERVRSRIAGGLALPVALLRTLGLAGDGSLVRTVVGPAAAVVAIGAAGVALVLPATGGGHAAAPARTRAARPLPARHATTPTVHVAPAGVAPAPTPTPIAVPVVQVSRRHGGTTVVHVKRPGTDVHTTPAPVRHVAAAAPARHTAVQRTTPIESTPDAGLAPCRAAHLCT